jgi:hypothetical protein
VQRHKRPPYDASRRREGRPLYKLLQAVKRLHEEDLQKGLGRVALPNALERKYPSADREWGWQWVFPATSHYADRVTGEKRRPPP